MAKGSKQSASPEAKKTGAPAPRKSAGGGKTAAKPRKSAAAKPAAKPGKSTLSAKKGASTAKKAAAPPKGEKKAARGLPPLEHVDGKTLKLILAKLEEMGEESRTVVNAHVQADLLHREEGSEVGDDMDQASSERDREFSLIIHQRHLRRLKQIEDAFERINDGTYGLCEGTDEPINPKRLLIMPLARFSLDYQQQQEKMLGRSPEDAFSQTDELISDE